MCVERAALISPICERNPAVFLPAELNHIHISTAFPWIIVINNIKGWTSSHGCLLDKVYHDVPGYCYFNPEVVIWENNLSHSSNQKLEKSGNYSVAMKKYPQGKMTNKNKSSKFSSSIPAVYAVK